MKPRFFCALFLSLAVSAAASASSEPSNTAPLNAPLMSVDQVRPGMKGVAYTVFQGTQPEAMEVEILGVLRDVNGPKSNIILVRLRGEKPEYSGRGRGHERQPRLRQWEAAGGAGVPHWPVLQGTDRRGHSHRRHAGDQRTRPQPPSRHPAGFRQGASGDLENLRAPAMPPASSSIATSSPRSTRRSCSAASAKKLCGGSHPSSLPPGSLR